jgi:hypothetical protein
MSRWIGTREAEEWLLLLKAIYGLVQSARQFQSFVSILKKINTNDVPILFDIPGPLVYMAIYRRCCGENEAAINDSIKVVKTELNVTVKDDPLSELRNSFQ